MSRKITSHKQNELRTDGEGKKRRRKKLKTRDIIRRIERRYGIPIPSTGSFIFPLLYSSSKGVMKRIISASDGLSISRQL